LQRWCMWFPCRVSQWIVEKCCPWRVHGPGDIQGAAHTQGRNASRLDVPGDQSDGLMADGSHWDEQHSIDVFSQETLEELRCQFLLDTLGRVDAAHEGIGVGCQSADHAFAHQAS
jgi:hypothetical protein